MRRLVVVTVAACSLALASCGTDDGAGGSTDSELSCRGSSNLAMLWGLVESGTFLNPSELPTPGPGWVN